MITVSSASHPPQENTVVDKKMSKTSNALVRVLLLIFAIVTAATVLLFVTSKTSKFLLPFTTQTSASIITPASIQNDPVGVPDNITVYKKQYYVFSPVANDYDPNLRPQPITLAQVDDPSHGVVTLFEDRIRVSYQSKPYRCCSDKFDYYMTNNVALVGPVFVYVTIINRLPVARNFILTVHKGSTNNTFAMFNLMDSNGTKISDPDDDIMKIVSVTVPAFGSAFVNNNTLYYTPGANFVGTDNFKYSLTDFNDTVSGNITIQVVNDPPVANPVTDSVARGLSKVIDVLAFCSDVNGDELYIVDVETVPGTSTVTIVNNKLLFTAGSTVSTVTFNYTIADSSGAMATSHVFVDIFNIRPVAIDDFAEVKWNSQVIIDVVENDYDENPVDLPELRIRNYTQPANGQVQQATRRQFLYTPNAGFLGMDEFYYTVSDQIDVSANFAKVTVHVVDRPPVLADDSATLHWGSSVNIDVLLNDEDPDGDELVIVSVSQPSKGSTQITEVNGAQLVTYTASGFNLGSDSFIYSVTDGILNASATVSVTITDTAPVANSNSFEIHWRSPAVTFDVLSNDFDADGDDLSILSVDFDAQFAGNISISSDMGYIIYQPTTPFKGVQQFTYRNTDGPLPSNSAVVYVNHTNNAFPEEKSVNYAIHWSTQQFGYTFRVFDIENPVDADGDELSFALGSATFGTVTYGKDNANIDTITYKQPIGFTGQDTFTYTVSDGLDSADITVTVTVYNNAPVAQDFSKTVHWSSVYQGYTVDAVSLSNATDADSQDAISISSVTPSGSIAAIGSVSFSGREITFMPETGYTGSLSLQVIFTDGLASVPIEYTITVTNNAPVASPQVINEHWSNMVQGVLVDVLASLSDADGDSISFTIEDATNGIATIEANKIRLKQEPVQLGPASFTLRYTDGWINQTATWTIIVSNSVPVVENKSVSIHWTAYNLGVQVNVLENSYDVDMQDTVTLSGLVQPSQGQATILPSGAVLYKPTQGFVGQDSFSFIATDGFATATGVVHVTVENEVPVASSDSVTIHWSQNVVTLNVLANDFDPDFEDTVSIQAITQEPAAGIAQIIDAITGTISYTQQAPAVEGVYTFQYSVTDGAMTSVNDATVTINVTNLHKPTASPISSSIHWRDFLMHGLNITVYVGQQDLDGDIIELTITEPSEVSATVVGNNVQQINLETQSPFAGSISFDYTLSDGNAEATSTIQVDVTNNAPQPASFVVVKSKPQTLDGISIDVLSRAFDADVQDRNSLVIVSVTSSVPVDQLEVVTSEGQDEIFVKPTTQFVGNLTVEYTISDGISSSTAEVLIAIIYSAQEQIEKYYSRHWSAAPQPFDLLQEIESELPLTLTAVAQLPSDGTVVIANNKAIYTQNNQFLGVDTFTVGYTDGVSNSIVNVTVEITNKAPCVSDSSVSLHWSTLSSGYQFNPLLQARDKDHDPLSVVSAVLTVGSGTVTLDQGIVTVVPSQGFVGLLTVEFVISDQIQTTSGLHTIASTNAAPVTAPKSYSIHWRSYTGQGLVLDVTSGDVDADGDTITLVSVSALSNPDAGTVSIEGNSVRIIAEDGHFVSQFLFQYTVSDGAMNGQVTQTVTVVVTNTAPTAVNDNFRIHWKNDDAELTPLTNDSDAESDPLSVKLVTPSSSAIGSISVTSAVYFHLSTPRFLGSFTFAYTVTDGPSDSVASMTVEVYNNAPNTVPFSDNRAWVSVPVAGIPFHIIGANGVSDPDPEDTLTLVPAVTNLLPGATVSFASGTLYFTPPAGFIGTTTFQYQVTDGITVSSNNIVVTITTNPPQITPYTFDIHWRSVTKLLGNDLDLDPIIIRENPVTYTFDSISARGGTLRRKIGSSNYYVLNYRQQNTILGADSFNIYVSDQWSPAVTGSVGINVFNNKPVAQSFSVRAMPTIIRIIPIVGRNDQYAPTDADAADAPFLTVNIVPGSVQPAWVDVQVTGGRSIIVFPVLFFSQTISFQYTVFDGIQHSDPATITLSVGNVAPTLQTFSRNLHWRDAIRGYSIDLLEGASDEDGDSLRLVAVSKSWGATGQIVDNIDQGSSVITYYPTAKSLGDNHLTYYVTDGFVTVSSTFRLSVYNNAPTNGDISLPVRHWRENTFSFDVLDYSEINDQDVQDIPYLTVKSLQGASLAPNTRTVINYSNTIKSHQLMVPDRVYYRISDERDESARRTIEVTFRDAAPVAQNYNLQVHWSNSVSIQLSGSCSDSDAQDAQFVRFNNLVGTSSFTQSDIDRNLNNNRYAGNLKGRLTIQNASQYALSYKPDPSVTYDSGSSNYRTTTAMFQYTCTDDLLQGTGTVFIQISNTRPVAPNRAYTLKYVKKQRSYVIPNLLVPGLVDADGDVLSLKLTGATLDGNNAILAVAGNFNGETRTFTYRFSDGQLDSPAATVTVYFN